MKPILFALIILVGLKTPLFAETSAEKIEEINTETIVPHGVGYGFDALWVMGVGKLWRIDPKDISITEIPVEGAIGSYRTLAFGEGAVWVPDMGSKTIYKIDPRVNRVVMKIGATLFDSDGAIGVGEGSVWALIRSGNEILSRYDAGSGVEKAWVQLPSRSYGRSVLVDFGRVWVTGAASNELYQIDPQTNLIVETTRLHEKPWSLTSGMGSVWVLNQGDGTVQRIDANSGQVVATIEAGVSGSDGDLTAGGNFVWVTSQGTPVIKIDPQTNSVIGKFRYATRTVGDTIRYGGGSLWIAGHHVFRIKQP